MHASASLDLELAAASFLARLFRGDALHGAALLEATIRGARAGAVADEAMLLGCALSFARGQIRPAWATATARAASEQELALAARFLAEDAPHRALPARAALPDVGLSAYHVPLLHPARLPTSQQRGQWDARMLRWRHEASGYMGRLRRHTSPRFVRRLLEEPALELRDVVAIAARRPTDAAILVEIAASGRWVRHLPVREALVDNPFASPGMAVKYLATLPSPFVRRVARAAELHPLLRDAARAYLDAA